MSAKPKRVKPRARPYRYYVGKGNNPDLVREIMGSRDWWEEITQEEVEAGVPYNFKWKQLNYRKSELENLGSVRGVRQCCNHFENNMELCAKAGLFRNITYFYERVLQRNIFEAIPVTFNFTSLRDPEYAQFLECYNACAQVKQLVAAGELDVNSVAPEGLSTPDSGVRDKPKRSPTKGKEEPEERKPGLAYNFRFSSRAVHPKDTTKNVWILKPGHGTNRAIGIKVFSELSELEEHLERWNTRKHPVFNWIVQKYMERPLLINKRKFDIRAYAVVSHALDLYFYNEGYLRTSGEVYDLNNLEDRNVHLTNWAVQKKAESYGEHEDANQMDFQQFQEYLDLHHPEAAVSVEHHLKERMKELVLHTFLAGGTSFNLNNHKYCVELLGYDFMVDQDFKVVLIEVNNNPCLCTPGDATGEILPKLLQDMMKVVLDPLFPATGDPLGKTKPKLAGTDFVLLHCNSDKATMDLREKSKLSAKEAAKDQPPKEGPGGSPKRLSARGQPRPPVVQPAVTQEEALEEEQEEEEEEEQQEQEGSVEDELPAAQGLTPEPSPPPRTPEPAPGLTIQLSPQITPRLVPQLTPQPAAAQPPRPSAPCMQRAHPGHTVVSPWVSDAPQDKRANRLQKEAWSPSMRLQPAAQKSLSKSSCHLERPQLARMDLSAGCSFLDSPAGSELAVAGLRHQVELLAQHRQFKSKPGPGRRCPPQAQLRAPPHSQLPGILSPPGSHRRRPVSPAAASNESAGTPQRMVREAASEAEDVARQLRDAGMLNEAAQLERLRVELLQPGTDLTAKKNEARNLAERLRAQARDRPSGVAGRALEAQRPRGSPTKNRFTLHVDPKAERGRSGPGGLPAVCGTTFSLSPSVINIG